MNARFKKYRFNGKMKHYSEGSKLYKAYKQSIEFLCEVEGAQFQNAFTTKEIEAACPIMKRTNVNEKRVWVLQNPETKKWAVISEDQVNELNDLYMFKKYGVKVEDNPFILKA